MFKRIILLFAFCSVALSLTSCSGKKSALDKKHEASNLTHLPKWVIDPKIKDSVAAVGIAPKSRGGLQFQIPKAEADARANIAAQIKTEVSRLTKDALREAKIDGEENVENIFSQVTKNLVKKVPLMGARRVNMYKDPNDGALYIHMSIDSEMVAKYFAKNKKLFNKAIKSEISKEKMDAAQKAVDNLYEELNEELDK